MSELHILDVGRADCCVLLLDTPEGVRTVVVVMAAANITGAAVRCWSSCLSAGLRSLICSF